MKLVLFFLLLMSPLTWAALQQERNVSIEVPTNDVKLAKPVLLFQAVSDSITALAKEINLNDEEFRKNLNKKFEIYFEKYKERMLSQKFGKDYSTSMTSEQKSEFLKGLLNHRDSQFRKFSRFLEIPESFSFKSIERSPKKENLWNAKVELSLDRVKLDRLIKRVNSEETKQYSQLYILQEMNLNNFSWKDLGIEKSTNFTIALIDSWNKWLISNQPTNVEEVSSCRGECQEDFEDWIKIKQDDKTKVDPEKLNTLWIKVIMDVRRLAYDEKLNEWKFSWDGRVVLYDGNTKRDLATEEIPTEIKTWRDLDQKKLNSALASGMYRSPLGVFKNFISKIQDSPQLNRVVRLVIQGHKNASDVLSLMDVLKKEGQKLHLELKMDSLSQKEAQVICFYQGEEKSFSDLLSRLKELKLSHSYQVVNDLTGVNPVLKLVAE